MSFRVPALVAALAVLGLGSITPAHAQPQAPVRPRYTQFQSMFGGGRPLVANPGQGILGLNQPNFINPNGPNAPVFLNAAGQPILNQGLTNGAYGVNNGAYGLINPYLVPTGVVGQFGNLGHWYNYRSGYYGHWYPNGIQNGAGVIGNSGAIYGGFVGPRGMTGGPIRAGGSMLGTTMMGAATVNQFRR
jgi:hypothetical protein